eukprot:scaffold658832_cov57-Prasinocladus_malaysianus.AAC.2
MTKVSRAEIKYGLIDAPVTWWPCFLTWARYGALSAARGDCLGPALRLNFEHVSQSNPITKCPEKVTQSFIPLLWRIKCHAMAQTDLV